MMNMLDKIFPALRSGKHRGLLAIEWIALVYMAVTTTLVLVLWDDLRNPIEMLVGRGFILGGTALLWILYALRPCRLTLFTRVTAQMSLLAYWYPETYEFNSVFQNLDHLFAEWEQILFGGQPSLWFSEACPEIWFSEPFNMGYFAYYPMILLVALFYFFCRYAQYEKATFIIMCSFFIYYLIYIFVPVVGPQFYFQAIGLENPSHGHYSEMGTYFAQHTEMLPAPGDSEGFFYNLVGNAQASGERPTAAFPSSHIGISGILMILAFRSSRKLAWVMMPFFVLLCCATVYIQAHYLIDAIAGIISAPLIYLCSKGIYQIAFERKK